MERHTLNGERLPLETSVQGAGTPFARIPNAFMHSS